MAAIWIGDGCVMPLPVRASTVMLSMPKAANVLIVRCSMLTGTVAAREQLGLRKLHSLKSMTSSGGMSSVLFCSLNPCSGTESGLAMGLDLIRHLIRVSIPVLPNCGLIAEKRSQRWGKATMTHSLSLTRIRTATHYPKSAAQSQAFTAERCRIGSKGNQTPSQHSAWLHCETGPL